MRNIVRAFEATLFFLSFSFLFGSCDLFQTETYTITYHANKADSGFIPIDFNEYEVGQEVTVCGNSGDLQREGFFFGGWNTQGDGTGTTYQQNDTFIIGNKNITLYALWAKNPPLEPMDNYMYIKFTSKSNSEDIYEFTLTYGLTGKTKDWQEYFDPNIPLQEFDSKPLSIFVPDENGLGFIVTSKPWQVDDHVSNLYSSNGSNNSFTIMHLWIDDFIGSVGNYYGSFDLFGKENSFIYGFSSGFTSLINFEIKIQEFGAIGSLIKGSFSGETDNIYDGGLGYLFSDIFGNSSNYYIEGNFSLERGVNF